MRHWFQLATRNWWAKPVRAGAVVLAVALGVATVVTVVSIYQSVEFAIGEQVLDNWVGRSDLNVQTPLGHWGNVDPRLADEMRTLPNVARLTVRFNTPMRVRVPAGAPPLPSDRYRVDDDLVEINAIGIDPTQEYAFREPRDLVGRRIAEGDTSAVVVDREMARDFGLQVGDTLAVEPFIGDPTVAIPIVGTFAAARVGMFQRPSVYLNLEEMNRLRKTRSAVSVIDVIVQDDSAEALEATAERVRELVRSHNWNYEVTTATAKLNQLRAAQQITRLVLVLFSVIALMTSFFIIVTTMSMGMMERIRLLGMMRCVGVTRGQLALLMLVEVLPLGVAGVALGIPMGMGLTHLGVAFVPYVGTMVQTIVFGAWGLTVASVGGLVTTLAAAVVVLLQATGVSPLRAMTPEARGSRPVALIVAVVIAAGLFGLHALLLHNLPPLAWIKPVVALTGMGSLYGAYVLLAPAGVLLIGSAALFVVAPLVGIRRKLLRDQMGRAPWRSAGVCWMLMVGLSLIVFFGIRGESIVHAWDFPSKMAGAFVWAERPFAGELLPKVRALPGVRAATPIHDVLCSVESGERSILNMFKTKSVFVAGDPDTFLAMTQLEFMEGSEADAREKLAKGGYVLLPEEAAHAFNRGVGDSIPVTIGSSTCTLEVAGVVRSPAIDIAVSFFQADTYMMIASASAVLGTLQDLQRCFHVADHSMYLLDVEVGTAPAPEVFASAEPPALSPRELARLALTCLDRLPAEQAYLAPQRAVLEAVAAGADAELSYSERGALSRFADAYAETVDDWAGRSMEERWQIFREELILDRVKLTINRPQAMSGSVRRLKQRIDRDIRTTTLIISAIPLVSLIVASIGVANLMMVNVASRTRQIAILRSIGATQSQIARMVIAEAMVLGTIGCLAGIGLGMHLAHADGEVWSNLIGTAFPWVVPWPRVVWAAVVTWLICVLSGVGPALRASRSDIIEALRGG